MKSAGILHTGVLAHFQAQADQLLAGDLDRFGEMFSLPLPIHSPDRLTVVFDMASGTEVLNQMRAEWAGRGIVALRPKISAIELPRGDRFRVWIDWTEIDAMGIEAPGSTIIYYCRKCPTGLRTEMMQYTYLSSPGLILDQDQIALSA